MQSNYAIEQTNQKRTTKGWITTFADLMTLLLCFFVLLFSFSSLDIKKFEALTESFQRTFSTVKQQDQGDIPKGDSAIKLHKGDSLVKKYQLESGAKGKQSAEIGGQSSDTKLVRNLRALLSDEISNQYISVSGEGQQVVIRLQEGAAFAAGSGFLQPKFEPIIAKIGNFLVTVPGQITVAGHTDASPIANEMFANNSELSVARAMAVSQILSEQSLYSDIIITGYGASMPLADSATSQSAIRNRRVEIWIVQGHENVKQLPKLN
ncbi:MAG: flagellar motor protein MotB [Aestuariibacter sp.]